MDATGTLKLLKQMPCDTCGQILPVGYQVSNVKCNVVPRFERTANYASWDLDAMALDTIKVTCGDCLKKLAPPIPAEIGE